MNLLPIILYLIGVVGIIISLLLIVFAIKRGAKSSLNLVEIVFLLSIILISAGTGITFFKKESSFDQVETQLSTQPIDKEIKVIEASIDDLNLQYKLYSLGSSTNKNAEMIINNNSDSIFNGEIKLTFTDSSQTVTDTLSLPIKNFMPNTSYKPTAIVSSNAVNLDYSFSGKFDTNIDKNIPFTIKKITFGNKFFRFDVSVEDTSSQNLKNICNQFAAQYDLSLCDGFLIYFYPSTENVNVNFNDAIGDFHLDNVSKKSKLIIY